VEIRAYAIKERGDVATPFTYRRTFGAHDVLVRIAHRSVTTGDVELIDNAWSDTPYPLVPCHAMVGLVEQADGDVTDLESGDRVGVGFQLGACFECGRP
jgi:D-arabinose 1-dehydrogenase-like Zn-dependent alcohol dehydrogenase